MEAALEGKKGQRGETKSASGCCCCCGVRESVAEEGLGYVKVELDGQLDRTWKLILSFSLLSYSFSCFILRQQSVV